jgi:hypothetical protein
MAIGIWATIRREAIAWRGLKNGVILARFIDGKLVVPKGICNGVPNQTPFVSLLGRACGWEEIDLDDDILAGRFALIPETVLVQIFPDFAGEDGYLVAQLKTQNRDLAGSQGC